MVVGIVAARIRLNRICQILLPIWFHFSKEGWDHTVQNQPIYIWSGSGSGFGQMCLVRKQAGVQESLGLVSGIPWTEDLLSSCGNPASYQFSTFRLGCVLPQMAHITLCKTSLDQDLVLADCVRFWPNGSGPEVKPVCKKHPARFWPVLSSRSGLDANRIWHVLWELVVIVQV